MSCGLLKIWGVWGGAGQRGKLFVEVNLGNVELNKAKAFFSTVKFQIMNKLIIFLNHM